MAAALWFAACASDEDIERPVPLAEGGGVEYPPETWTRDIEGTTLLRVLVNAEGGVDSVLVGETSGYPTLDSAAVAGARAMLFLPAERRGRPVGVWVRLPVHFRKDSSERRPGSAAR